MDATLVKTLARGGALVVDGVVLATPLVAFLEHFVGIPDASSVYIVAVVVSAMVAGTLAALATAVAAILTYDLLFTEPFLTLVITDTSEWLSLVLFSFVGISVGQLVSLQRQRTREAQAREREAQDLHAVTRLLATRTATETALAEVAAVLSQRTGMDRVWSWWAATRQRSTGTESAPAPRSQARYTSSSGAAPDAPPPTGCGCTYPVGAMAVSRRASCDSACPSRPGPSDSARCGRSALVWPCRPMQPRAGC